LENYPSKHLETAVNELSKLPGIGRKTALRLAIHLLKQDEADVDALGRSLVQLKKAIRFCKTCHNISDNELCEICQNPKRDRSIVCVVENINDVMAIEKTSQYRGLYHVLGGVISPMDGIGPTDVNITSLVQRVTPEKLTEIILALPATIEGDTTSYYIHKRLKGTDVLITALARGINVGDELEYTDEITLGRSITNRIPYNHPSGK